MDKDNQIKPWFRNIVAFAVPFDEDGNYRVDSKYDGVVTLTKQTLEEHILPKHPEVDLNWTHIEETLQDPDTAVAEGDSRTYYKEFPLHQIEVWNQEITAPAKQPYFTVIIQISNKFIKTIFEQKGIKERHKPKEEQR